MRNICYVITAITIFTVTGCKDDSPSEPPASKEPIVEIITPGNNSSVYGNTYIEVEVTHDIKIARVDVYIDGISDPGKTFEWDPGMYRYVWSIPQSVNGRTYNLYATAEDEEGNTGRSETIEVVVYQFSAPTDLNITHISENEVQLVWKDNTEHEEGYIIERRKSGDFSEIARVGANTNSFNDNTITVNSNYKYRVQGYTDSFLTNYSNEIEITYRQNLDMSNMLEGHTGSVVTCDYNPDGSILATGSSDFTINLWNTSEGTLINTLQGHTGYIKKIAFTPDGEKLISAGSDSHIRIWSAETGELLQSFLRQPHTDDINGLAVSPDGTKFVTAGKDELIILWNLETDDTLKTVSFFIDDFSAQARPILDIKYSPNGDFVAMLQLGAQEWNMPDNIYIFNPEAERLTFPQMNSYSPYPDETNLFSICYNPDGNYILATAGNGRVYAWDTNLPTVRRAIQFQTHYLNTLYSADFSTDDNWIICGGSNGYIYLANCAESKVVDVTEIKQGAVYSVMYSPDGTQAASCHQNGNVILWDVRMRWVGVD